MNGIDVEVKGSRGGLSLAWKGDIAVTLRSFSKYHINVMVKEGDDKEEWRLTSFYGLPYVQDKSVSWDLLRKLGQDKNYPWLVCGYFNKILYSFEKRGGIPREERRMKVFRETLEVYQLEDLGFMGTWYTWERGNLLETNIRERLDRRVANDKLRHIFPIRNI